MGADNMRNPEAGISRFAINTPTRERRTDTPDLPKQDTKPIPAFPQPEKQKKGKIPPSSKAVALRVGGAVAAVATGAPAVIHHVNYETELTPPAVVRDVKSIPGFYSDLGKSAVDSVNRMFQKIKNSRPAETATPFDPAKLDTERQVVDYTNSRDVTPEEIQKLISSPIPEVKKFGDQIKTSADLPRISVLPLIDLRKTGKAEISKPAVGTYIDGVITPVHTIMEFVFEKKGAPMPLLIPQGINSDTVEIFLKNPTKTVEEVRFDILYEKFDLGNNKYYIYEIRTTVNNAIATDAVKKAPPIDPGRTNGNYIKDIIGEKGTILKIQEKPDLFTTGSPNARIAAFLWYIDGDRGTGVIVDPLSQDGNFLVSSSR